MTVRMSNKEVERFVYERLRNDFGEDYLCPHGYDNYGSYCPKCDKEFVKMIDEVKL